MNIGFSPATIQYLLKERGITQAQIARQCGVHPMTVSKVVNRLTVSDRIMRAIATAIGVDHHIVFADYYTQPPKRGRRKVA